MDKTDRSSVNLESLTVALFSPPLRLTSTKKYTTKQRTLLIVEETIGPYVDDYIIYEKTYGQLLLVVFVKRKKTVPVVMGK